MSKAIFAASWWLAVEFEDVYLRRRSMAASEVVVRYLNIFCIGCLVMALILGTCVAISIWYQRDPVRQKIWELVDPDGPASSRFSVSRFSRVRPNQVIVASNGTLIRANPVMGSNLKKSMGAPIDPFLTMQQYVDEFGPEVFKHLNDFAIHRDTIFTGYYRKLHVQLPNWVTKNLPPPPPHELISGCALEIIHQLGPVAARACSEAVIEGLDHPNPMVQDFAIRSFWWLLPDSDLALERLLNDFDQGEGNLIDRGWYGDSIMQWKWSQDFPQRLQLTNALQHVLLVKRAVYTLGAMKEDATPVIPMLIEIVEKGQWNPQGSLELYGKAGLRNLPVDYLFKIAENRQAAARILSSFAPNHPNVLASLMSRVEDGDPFIRGIAGSALVDKAIESAEIIPKLLPSLQDPDMDSWITKMRAIGHMGERAQEMVPSLMPFTSEEFIKSWYQDLPLEDPQPLSGTHLRNMKLCAVVAVGRIDSGLIEDHLQFLVETIGLHQDPIQLLKEATSLSDKMIPLVEVYLKSPSENKQIIAADLLLHHDLDHRNAIETLERHIKESQWSTKERAAKVLLLHKPQLLTSNKTFSRMIHEASMEHRITAAYILASANGDMQILIPLLEQGLQSTINSDVQKALTTIRQMEEKPNQLIPMIQNTLRILDRSIHEKCFMLLLDYGPEY